VIIMNFDTKPGYAGVDNQLYGETYKEKVSFLEGDAKDSLQHLLLKLSNIS
jgi:NAD(P) transhydrogenase